MPSAFLGKFLSFFHGSTEGEGGKKRIFKRLAKEISASRHSRFYKPKSALIDPSLGAFFYEMYKTVARVPASLQNAARSDILKEITLESFLDIKYLDARQRLNADYVTRQAQVLPIPEVSEALRKDLELLSSAFEGTLIADADECYNQILALVQLASFGFFALLKKFDSNFAEGDFNYQPQFHPVPGEALSEELKDFLELSAAVDPDGDWTMALRALKICKNGIDVVIPGKWKNLLSQLREIRKSGILELMIRHIDHDPGWQSMPKEIDEHIARNYLDNRRIEVRNAINGCVNAQKNAQAYELAALIFNDPKIKSTRYYTEEHSEIYTAKNFEGFTYIEGINYLKVFLFDIFEKDILPFCEMLIIRGQWAEAEQSQKMSDCYRELLEICDKLAAFDDSLSEEGAYGAQLRSAIARVSRSKSQARTVTHTLRFVNAQALDLINTSARVLISIGQILKNIYEDYPREFHEFILNMGDLNPMTEVPMLQHILNTYKQIYNFIQLMHIISRPAAGPALKAEAAGA